MATKNISGLSQDLHAKLVELVEALKSDLSVNHQEKISCKIGDLISDNYARNGRNRVRSGVVKFLNQELGAIPNYPILKHKNYNNIYPISHLFLRDDLSPVKATGKKNLVAVKRENIDAIKLIELARVKLYSDDWREILVGLAFLTGRRQVEVAYATNFQEYDRNVMLVTGLLKKDENDDKSTYRIPTLVDASEIMLAIERFRTICKYKFERYSDMSISDSEPLFNGNECKQISNYLSGDSIALYVSNITGEKFEFRDLRTLYGSLWYAIQTAQSNPDYAIAYAQTALCHVDTGSTTHYLKYNFSNLPVFGDRVLSVDCLGLVAGGEKPLFEIKYSDLAKHLTPAEIASLLKRDIVKVIKTGLKETPENVAKPTVYSGTHEVQSNLTKIIDCMIRYNDAQNDKSQTVAFSTRTILDIYSKIFDCKVQEITIATTILQMANHINVQIEKYARFWASKKVGNRVFYTNKHVKNLDVVQSQIADIFRTLNE